VTTARLDFLLRVFIGELRDVIAITRVVVKELTIAKATVICVKVEIAYRILFHTFVGIGEQLQRLSLSSTSKRKKL
jgi:hypothetical protein